GITCRRVGSDPVGCRSFYPLGRRQPWSTLFPYTTLFRSIGGVAGGYLCRYQGVELSEVEALDFHAGDARVLLGEKIESFNLAERSEEHTSELQSRFDLVCRLLLEKKQRTGALGEGMTGTV